MTIGDGVAAIDAWGADRCGSTARRQTGPWASAGDEVPTAAAGDLQTRDRRWPGVATLGVLSAVEGRDTATAKAVLPSTDGPATDADCADPCWPESDFDEPLDPIFWDDAQPLPWEVEDNVPCERASTPPSSADPAARLAVLRERWRLARSGPATLDDELLSRSDHLASLADGSWVEDLRRAVGDPLAAPGAPMGWWESEIDAPARTNPPVGRAVTPRGTWQRLRSLGGKS